MKRVAVIAIFDVGKTNKKLVLFDEQYKVVYEEQVQLKESVDEDGFACEEVEALTKWIKDSFAAILKDDRFEIRAVNFSAYGASFVYLDRDLKLAAPLYNYLKPYNHRLQEKFYSSYGGESLVVTQTASPVLGSLNSGLQLYRLKYEQPALFEKIKFALHLPQYLSFILSGQLSTDITSLGCHTHLWNFQTNGYHAWVKKEDIESKLAPIKPCNEIAGYTSDNIPVGIGLHDSSAALIPYLTSFAEPFILLSTGTWCISLNPFNDSPLTANELSQDCLCYLSFEGKPVKAARLFAGHEHEQQIKRLSAHFQKPPDYFSTLQFDENIRYQYLEPTALSKKPGETAMRQDSGFAKRNLNSFAGYEKAYHQLIAGIIELQVKSTSLVLAGTAVKNIFVDGGFSKNAVYMNLLAAAFSGKAIYAATVPQASAMGAAFAIHRHWNRKALPTGMVAIQQYPQNR